MYRHPFGLETGGGTRAGDGETRWEEESCGEGEGVAEGLFGNCVYCRYNDGLSELVRFYIQRMPDKSTVQWYSLYSQLKVLYNQMN
jgi:hypothetical protein